MTAEALLQQITAALEGDGAKDAGLTSALDLVLLHFECTAGTLHQLDRSSGLLRLHASRGLPDTLLPIVQLIPIGKGMAGLAAARLAPVQLCNLQTDTSGTANPKAKETNMQGSIAVPMVAGNHLRGVLGIAKPRPYEFNQAEVALLSAAANAVAQFLV
jgi:GAF domain-containing protein